MEVRRLDDSGVWRLDTFRVSSGSLEDRATIIDGPEGHHAVDVIRVREGDIVRLIDGAGVEAIARVESAASSEAAVSILETRKHDRKGHVELTVAQALLKGRGFDEVVRRCSELGVADIVPVVTERTIGRIPIRAEESRPGRWDAIALAATKQSRGVFVPYVRAVRDIAGVVSFIEKRRPLTLVAWEDEDVTSLAGALEGAYSEHILLLVGPEGGLSAEEVDTLVGAGATPVSVGSRILKADWAAAAISAMISLRTGGLLP